MKVAGIITQMKHYVMHQQAVIGKIQVVWVLQDAKIY